MKRTFFAILFVALIPLILSATGMDEGDKSLVVYSAHTQEIIDALVPRLYEETGIRAEVVKLGSSDVVARVKAEAGNPQADVIWSIGGEQLEANSDLLAPYTPADWDKVPEVFRVGTNWLPYTGIVMVFVVNTDMVPANQIPRKWTDLSDPRLKEMISSARADKSGSSYMQLATVLNIYGEEKGWEVYEDMLANFVLSGSSSAVPRFVNDGEQAVGITLEDNAYRYVAGGGPVEIIYPEDGTTAAPDGMALIKGAPNEAVAKEFLDWALSKPTQDYLVETMGRRSVRVDGALPGALPDLADFKTVPYDFAWSAGNKSNFVEQWTELVQDLGL